MKSKLLSDALKIIVFVFITQVTFAACGSGSCPFSIDPKIFNSLKTNSAVVSYKIHRINKQKVNVIGILRDGNSFEIKQSAGDVWSITYQKKIPFDGKHALSDKKYWLNHTFLFAKQMWSKNNVAYFKNDMNQHRYTQKTTSTNKMIFEKYSEGNFSSVVISLSKKTVIIELKQAVC